MEKIENAIAKVTRDYPKSLKKFWPGYGNMGIPERNLTFQFVSAYLTDNREAHAFFEVPFKDKDKNEVLHYDAIVFDQDDLIIIEAKRLFSEGQARAIEADVERIITYQEFYKPHPVNSNSHFINFIPKNRYGLILAEAWEPRIENGLDCWWKGSGNMGEFEKWKKEDGICNNMNGWECKVSAPIDCCGNENFYILYGYKCLSA